MKTIKSRLKGVNLEVTAMFLALCAWVCLIVNLLIMS